MPLNLPGNTGFAVVIGLALAGCSPATPPEKPEIAATEAGTGARAYVTNEGSGDITVIDSAARKIIGKIAVGTRPRGIAASPDGQFLYVALSGSPAAGPGVDESKLPPANKAADGIAVIETATNKVLRVLRGISDPEQVAVSPDGKRLYVASEDTGRLVVIDPISGAILANLAVGDEPEGVAASPDGKIVHVTSEADNSVVVVDAAALKILARIPVGERPRSVVFGPGNRAYVSGENDGTVTAIDTATNRKVGITQVSGDHARPMGLALTNDGKSLFTTTGRGGQLARIDTATMKQDAAIDVGKRPWGLAQGLDGTLYTANGPSNDVTLVDGATMTILARLPAGERPWGVAVIDPQAR